MPYASTRDDVRIFYQLVGNGPITLVFIHPPGMGHVTFKQQLPLAKKFRLLYLDLRGNGRSGRNEEPITIPMLATDIFDVCQELNLKNFFIVGYSNGASIAMEFALTYPPLVEGLILVGAFPKVNSVLLFGEFLLGIWATKVDQMPLIAKVIGHAHAYSKEFGRELESYILKTDASTLHEMYNEGVKYDCTSKLKEIKAPILLVYGQRDYYVHHYQKEFAALHQQTQIIYISKAKHQVPTRFPNEFNTILQIFINKHAPTNDKTSRKNF
ncbi:alpha/beta fold hydrolase [Sutcliffiella halmapala]|uniref:alpha/beta fold hydrolase n=1 Tax=Sutcliffiella halmapala TaxID=79882 RepID=UPI0009959CB7|nr:alpha/beta hydrolase [Sutcliffiella halmapala]